MAKLSLLVFLFTLCVVCLAVSDARGGGGRGGGGGGRGGGGRGRSGSSRSGRRYGVAIIGGRGHYGEDSKNNIDTKQRDAPEVNEVDAGSRDKRDESAPVDESKDIRGGGGRMTGVIVAVIVVVLGIIVLVLVFYLLCYFCGNLCTKKSDVIEGDIEKGHKGRISNIEENDDIPASESAALLKNYSGREVPEKDDTPQVYDEYTLNEKGEKVKASPIEVEDNSKPPKLYPSVAISEPPPSEEKKPIYPSLDDGPVVTTATIERGKDTPPPESDNPYKTQPISSLDEPDSSVTKTKEPIASTPSPGVLSSVPMNEPAIVYTAPVARSAPIGEEKPKSPKATTKPIVVPNKHEEEPDQEEENTERDLIDRPDDNKDKPTEEKEKPREEDKATQVAPYTEIQPREEPKEASPAREGLNTNPVSVDPERTVKDEENKPNHVDTPVFDEEPTPLREHQPNEPKREFVQPLTRASCPSEPVIHDAPTNDDLSLEKPVIVPILTPADDDKKPSEEPKTESRSDEKPAHIEEMEKPQYPPSSPVVIKPRQGIEEPDENENPDEEELAENDNREVPTMTTPVYNENKPKPVIAPEGPVEYVNTPDYKSPTDEPAEEDTLPAIPVITVPPSTEHNKPQKDTTTDSDSGEGDSEKPEDEPIIVENEADRRSPKPEEGRPEPVLVICPPAPTDWEADETPLSPDFATLPIRSPNTTENEIPVMHSPSYPKDIEHDSSSPESVSLQSEDGIILNPSEEVPNNYSKPLGSDNSVPLADMDEDISDKETDGEDEVDLPEPATGPLDLQETPVKSPPTAISHPKVLGYENPQSSDSSVSHSPTERVEPTSEEDHPNEEIKEGSPETVKEKQSEKSSSEESESDGNGSSPLPPDEPGSRDSGFMSMPRGSRPPKGQSPPLGTPVSNGTPNSNVLSPEESEQASKLADQIIEEAKLAIQDGKA